MFVEDRPIFSEDVEVFLRCLRCCTFGFLIVSTVGSGGGGATFFGGSIFGLGGDRSHMKLLGLVIKFEFFNH